MKLVDSNQVENVKRLILRFDQGQDLNPDIARAHASASTARVYHRRQQRMQTVEDI